jgi:hypothetical protein
MATATAPTPTGVYLEFRNGTRAMQVVITPEAKHPADPEMIVPATLIYRMVSAAKPRAQWKVSAVDKTTENEPNYLAYAVSQVARGVETGYPEAWKFDKPLFLGISPDDLHQAHEGATPEALLRRVAKLRTDAGFPADLYDKK